MGNILRMILGGSVKTIETAPTVCICSHCKGEIDSNHLYSRFTGELFHVHCLMEYTQKLGILEIIVPQRNNGEN